MSHGLAQPDSKPVLIPRRSSNHIDPARHLRYRAATGGWTDPLISPLNEVNLFNRVREAVGTEQIDSSYRLFMKPGINHCGGGEGADAGDLLGVLENWVEHGTAPTHLTATRSANGAVQFTRPLCRFPEVAVYSGQGNQKDAASFVVKRGWSRAD